MSALTILVHSSTSRLGVPSCPWPTDKYVQIINVDIPDLDLDGRKKFVDCFYGGDTQYPIYYSMAFSEDHKTMTWIEIYDIGTTFTDAHLPKVISCVPTFLGPDFPNNKIVSAQVYMSKKDLENKAYYNQRKAVFGLVEGKNLEYMINSPSRCSSEDASIGNDLYVQIVNVDIPDLNASEREELVSCFYTSDDESPLYYSISFSEDKQRMSWVEIYADVNTFKDKHMHKVRSCVPKVLSAELPNNLVNSGAVYFSRNDMDEKQSLNNFLATFGLLEGKNLAFKMNAQ